MSSYHHGDLRSHVLAGAVELIANSGPDAVSLRDLARRAGVSHAAPAHHFRDRRGLFTAVAAEGFSLLADALTDSVDAGEFDRTAVAYVRFAVSHPGHYAVMFRTDLVTADDPILTAARRRSGELLDRGVDSLPAARVRGDRAQARRIAWSMVHGVAMLWLGGALADCDPEALALAGAHQLFGG